MRRDPRLIAVLVVGVVVAVTWVAAAKAPTPSGSVAAKSSVIALRQSTLVCPQAGGTPDNGAARIAYADAEAAVSAGSVLTAQALGPAGSAAPVALQAGKAWVVDGPTAIGPVQLTASGSAAESLSAVQFTRAPVGPASQISAVQCEGAMTDAWFAGFSSEVGVHATLLLSNVDTVPASVDVSIWGGAGGEPNIQRGIAVDPLSQVQVSLDQVEPGLSVGVVHVVATAGRVVPALRDDAENGSIPLGVDWLPPTGAPAKSQIVPGILGDAGSRRLIVADPGDLDATVSLTVVTADGSFEPTEFASVQVAAGTVSDVTLDPVLQSEAAAVIVNSTEPVVVGGISALPLDATGASDFAFTAAALPLSGPTVVAGGEIAVQRRTELVLSAPGADAQVIVSILPTALGSTRTENPVTVPGGTTMVLDLSTLTGDAAPGVVVTPLSRGPVYAAWSLEETSSNGASSAVTNAVSSAAPTVEAGTGAIAELVLATPVRSLLRPPARFDPAVGVR
jgi:Family of unknown function (DUF5719)